MTYILLAVIIFLLVVAVAMATQTRDEVLLIRKMLAYNTEYLQYAHNDLKGSGLKTGDKYCSYGE